MTIFRLTRAGSGAYTMLAMWGLIRFDCVLLKTVPLWRLGNSSRRALEKLDLSRGEARG